jgi:uncharacterized protein (TIGR02145 family)
MTKTKFTLFSVLVFLTISCTKTDPAQPDTDINQGTSQTFKDTRDDQVYNTVKIGNQIWMKENLNYSTPTGSLCFDCATYGRLYDWETAMTIAPPGWHLPTQNEFATLINFLGGEQISGGKMKTTTGWDMPNLGATNTSGFSGLPAGLLPFNTTSPVNVKRTAIWWNSTVTFDNFINVYALFYGYDSVTISKTQKQLMLSVRCIKDY